MSISLPIPGQAPGIELLRRLSPYVRQCGDARRPAWRIDTRRLLDYLLVYIAEGEGRFVVDGVAYDAAPGDLFWIPPDTDHAMEGYEPGMVCPFVHFDLLYRPESHWEFSIPGGMRDLSDFGPLMHPPVPDAALSALCGRIRTHTNRRVGQLVREVAAEASRAQPYAVLRLSGLVLEIVAEILRGREGLSAEYDAHIPLLEEAAQYMADHCEETLSVEAVAEIADLSPSHFRHLFGMHFGRSPRAYLRRTRIRKAKVLMMGASLTLSEIAGRTGFASVHAFSRAFRAEEGIPPSQYRCCGETPTFVEGRRAPYSR